MCDMRATQFGIAQKALWGLLGGASIITMAKFNQIKKQLKDAGLCALTEDEALEKSVGEHRKMLERERLRKQLEEPKQTGGTKRRSTYSVNKKITRRSTRLKKRRY